MSNTRMRSGETGGFLASLAFTILAAVRDVYFGGLFQSTSPLAVAAVAFSLCSVVFLPIALARNAASVRRLLAHPRELVCVNATTALAWISFFYALRTIEPLLVQILFAGVGPLSVVWIGRWAGGPPAELSRAERPLHLGLLASLVLAAAVALGGLSGVGPQAVPRAALGVVLATGAGISISVSTVMSRRLNDAGVEATALVSLRFVGAVVIAIGLGAWLDGGVAIAREPFGWAALGAVLALIVLPIWVNQVGISLASPLTVRGVMALGPVLIFGFQLVESRLSPSPYSLAAGVLYSTFAVAAAVTRRRASVVIVAARPSPSLP